MSDFHARFAAAMPVLDNRFGEPLEIIPWVVGDFSSGGADPANPAFIVTGVLDTPVKTMSPTDGPRTNRKDVVMDSPSADFSRTAFAGRAFPQAGWRIRAISRPGAPSFKIASPAGEGGVRVSFTLVALGEVSQGP